MTSEPMPIAWIRPETADWFSSGQNGCKSEVSSIDLAISERAPYTAPLYSQTTIETLTRERYEAREALRRIAKQKLTSEIGDGELVLNDIEGGYDACILEARAVVDKGPTT